MATLNVADLNRQGKVFTAANVSAKSVIAVTTAMTGLIIYNPAGSGKKLVLIDVGWVWTTVPGAVHNMGIAMTLTNAVAPVTVTAAGSPAQAADGSGAAATAIAYDAATFGVAPVARRWISGASWGTSVGVSPYQAINRLDGSLVVAPGASAMLTVVTTTAVGMGSFTWAEVPV